MCDTVRFWIKDPEATSTHDMVPISCDEYISFLEKLASKLIYDTAASSLILQEPADSLEDFTPENTASISQLAIQHRLDSD